MQLYVSLLKSHYEIAMAAAVLISQIYHGVSYTVRLLQPGKWEWTIDPPASVSGLTKMKNVFSGSLTGAIDLVKTEIERQTSYGKIVNDVDE